MYLLLDSLILQKAIIKEKKTQVQEKGGVSSGFSGSDIEIVLVIKTVTSSIVQIIVPSGMATLYYFILQILSKTNKRVASSLGIVCLITIV